MMGSQRLEPLLRIDASYGREYRAFLATGATHE